MYMMLMRHAFRRCHYYSLLIRHAADADSASAAMLMIFSLSCAAAPADADAGCQLMRYAMLMMASDVAVVTLMPLR